MCGGRLALSVVCAGDVVIFSTGLILSLTRPFARQHQVRVFDVLNAWFVLPLVTGTEATRGYAVKMKVLLPLSFPHPSLVCIADRVTQHYHSFLEYHLECIYCKVVKVSTTIPCCVILKLRTGTLSKQVYFFTGVVLE